MSVASHARALAPARYRRSEARSVVARAVRHPASSTSEPPGSTPTSRRLALASVLALAYVPRAARALESYSGVGLEIFVGPDGVVKVVEAFGAGYVKKAGPAYEAGVRVNDAIVAHATGGKVGVHGTKKPGLVKRAWRAGFAKRRPRKKQKLEGSSSRAAAAAV